MRILYIDIDSLRPDHLGCYAYHRPTSPTIDRLAAEGLRFDHCYASDTPCMPSRTALFTGQFGIHSGVICHAGTPAEPFGDGVERRFTDRIGRTCWMRALRDAGHRTAAISSFGERHSAWWWYAGFSEVVNTGRMGMEIADQVTPAARRWLADHAREDHWFCHVNYWDPHTPYRTPERFGNPFADQPVPTWLTDDVRQTHWSAVGPQGARERGHMLGIDEHEGRYPRQPHSMSDMQQVRRMFDGYDTAVRYVDQHIDRLLNDLADAGVLDETAIIISADHGENLGELNIYGCHQTADAITARVPLIIRWPGVTDAAPGRVDPALHYHLDWAATALELAGGSVPENWDGRSFASALRDGRPEGRPQLVLSQAQGSCQRSVRFDHEGQAYLFIRTWHDGYHGLPERLLFDLTDDPHEQQDLTAQRPTLVAHAQSLLEQWTAEQLDAFAHGDRMPTVLAEGGPPHSRGYWPAYADRLRETGRTDWLERLAQAHGRPTQA